MLSLKSFIKTSCFASGAIIAGLFMLQVVLGQVLANWSSKGTELNGFQRVLIGITAFWTHFWWLASFFIVALVFFFVGIVAILHHAFAKSRL